jgi:hypothetical protein
MLIPAKHMVNSIYHSLFEQKGVLVLVVVLGECKEMTDSRSFCGRRSSLGGTLIELNKKFKYNRGYQLL